MSIEPKDGLAHDDETEAPRVPGLERLAMEREPARDLWPGIEARLRPQQLPARRRSWLPLALAASLAAGFAVLLGLQMSAPQPSPAGTQAVASAEPVQPRAADPFFESDSPAVRHENRALVKANLKIVADAQGQLRVALQQDPDSAYLQRLLQSNERQQRELRGLLANNRT